MKKLLLVCCIVIGVSTLSKAQGGGGFTPPTPEAQTAQLKTALTLTDAQEAKVLAIYKAQTASRDSITKAGGDMRTAMGPLRTAVTAKINAVLTPEQQTKFAAMPRGGRPGGG